MFINISNHASSSWSKKQLEEAHEIGGVIKDIAFPNVDPQATSEDIKRLAWNVGRVVYKLIEESKCSYACAMVQGEMSLTYHLVSLLEAYGIPCYVACSERKVIETLQEDGSTRKTSVFEFVQFRKY